ncbi:MarR family transcriptional regulator [Acidisoma sp. L85]|jgi:DNA-binding MarR family transcriptional regulator|uniref:MarR family transcriptional regulator n=1 Tax=Acidisoma sp. L85 TaxID=1641850 RepID=UPI00131C02F1|nr:MarR family transcriptional regulator [Acidisoma sp. L85]
MAQRPRDEEATSDKLLLGLLSSVLGMVRTKDPDLSMRQLAVLLTAHTAETRQTVRGLAAALDVSKPAITRALDRLTEHALVRRVIDPGDRRSVLVDVTKSGHALARSLGRASV